MKQDKYLTETLEQQKSNNLTPVGPTKGSTSNTKN